MSVHAGIKTIPDLIHALGGEARGGARFVKMSGHEAFFPYERVAARTSRAAGALQLAGLKPGERVAIILPTSIHFFDAFIGTQMAGGIPAALYPPFRLGRLGEEFGPLPRTLYK